MLWKFLPLAVFLWLAPFSAAAADYSVMITTDIVRFSTATASSCNDKVHAIVTLPKVTTGTHVLEGKWYRPDGVQQEYTKVPLELEPPGQKRLQLWLRIERASDAVDALFTHHEDEEFDGMWTIVVYWDGKKVATKKFNVHCL